MIPHNPSSLFPPYRGYVHALEVPAGSRLLFISGLTFGGARTNVLQGVVHLALFIVFVALIFSP